MEKKPLNKPGMAQNKDKVIKGKHIKLFIDDFNKKSEKISLHVNGPFSSEKDGEIIAEIVHWLNKVKSNEISIYINSPGGEVIVGLPLLQTIKGKFKRIKTYITYAASSMGSILFCIGTERYVYPYSRHMMHNYSTGYHGKASDIKTRVEFYDDHLVSFIKDAYVKQGFLSKKEFKKLLNGKEFWFDSKEMLERGIATDLIKFKS